METGEAASYPVAFVAGLLSFITPCVLPLVPVYLSILAGVSFDELTGRGIELGAQERREIHRRVLFNAIAFVIGFSIIFIFLGLVSGAVGALLARWGNWLVRILGVALVVLGLNMSGLYKPRWLNMEARFQLQKGKWGLVSSAVIGAAFAFGWTPCIGPILAAILAMAACSGGKLQGALLLAVYSLGLGVPFFLSALSVNALIAFTNKIKRHFHTMEIIVGTIIILVGIFLAIAGMQGLDRIRQRLPEFDWVTRWEERVASETEAPCPEPEEMDIEEGAVVFMDEEPNAEEWAGEGDAEESEAEPPESGGGRGVVEDPTTESQETP